MVFGRGFGFRFGCENAEEGKGGAVQCVVVERRGKEQDNNGSDNEKRRDY